MIDSLSILTIPCENEEDYIEHHGVLGMKWGVRRYQDKKGRTISGSGERYTRQGGKNYREEVRKELLKKGYSKHDSRVISRIAKKEAKMANTQQTIGAKKLAKTEEKMKEAKLVGDKARMAKLGKEWIKNATRIEVGNITYNNMEKYANIRKKFENHALATAVLISPILSGAIGGTTSGYYSSNKERYREARVAAQKAYSKRKG